MISVLDLISAYKPEIDWEQKAIRTAKNNLKGSVVSKSDITKEVESIKKEWDAKKNIGIEYQKKLCEKDLKKDPSCIYEGYTGYKQGGGNYYGNKLENNKTYLEKKLVSEKDGIIGYADKIYIKRGAINIIDNKVVEKIYRTGSFKTDKGFQVPSEKMLHPIYYLDSCNYNDYVLQLSFYMYLAWINNKTLKIGKLYINHINLNKKGQVVKEEMIEVPYMREEVKMILKHKKLNES